MSESKLAKWASTGIERETPEVKTLARTEPIPLLAGRQVVRTCSKVRGHFVQAKKDKWPAERLAEAIAPLLVERLEGTPEQARQVAIYLADEYTQIGETILIVSRVTGKAIARINDDDIWQPAMVPRESGSMAQPLPRLRPDLEGFLVQTVFDQDRDSQILARQARKTPETALVKAEGDPRLRAITKAGRADMISALREALPTLLQAAPGASGAFLRHFSISDTPPTDPQLKPLLKCTAMSRVTTPIADPATFNRKYDRQAVLKAQVANGWVRDIALTLSLAAKEHAREVVWSEAFLAEIPADIWVGPPDFARAMLQTGINILWLAVEGSLPMALNGPSGVLVLDSPSYDCRGREIFDRWEVAAVMEYTLYVDWSRVSAFSITGLPETDPVVEVLR